MSIARSLSDTGDTSSSDIQSSGQDSHNTEQASDIESDGQNGGQTPNLDAVTALLSGLTGQSQAEGTGHW